MNPDLQHQKQFGMVTVALDDETHTVTVGYNGETKDQQFRARTLAHVLYDQLSSEQKALAWVPYQPEPTDIDPWHDVHNKPTLQ